MSGVLFKTKTGLLLAEGPKTLIFPGGRAQKVPLAKAQDIRVEISTAHLRGDTLTVRGRFPQLGRRFTYTQTVSVPAFDFWMGERVEIQLDLDLDTQGVLMEAIRRELRCFETAKRAKAQLSRRRSA